MNIDGMLVKRKNISRGLVKEIYCTIPLDVAQPQPPPLRHLSLLPFTYLQFFFPQSAPPPLPIPQVALSRSSMNICPKSDILVGGRMAWLVLGLPTPIHTYTQVFELFIQFRRTFPPTKKKLSSINICTPPKTSFLLSHREIVMDKKLKKTLVSIFLIRQI